MTAPLVLSRPRAASTPPASETRNRGAALTLEQERPEESTTRKGIGPRVENDARSRDAVRAGDDAQDRDATRIAATATSLAVACLEIFAGVRRSDSISRWVDRALLEKIDQRAQLRAEVAPAKPIGDNGPTRTLRAGNARVCRVNDTVAEVTVVVRTQNRFRAVAIRLELLTTRWTMTALQTM